MMSSRRDSVTTPDHSTSEDHRPQAYRPDGVAPLAVLRRFDAHDGSLFSLLHSRCERQPDKLLMLFPGSAGEQRWSYREFEHDVLRASALYAARGVRHGDRIGVMSASHPGTVITLFALARLGAIMVPVNPDYGLEEAGYVLRHAEVSGVLCSPQCLRVAQAACAAMPVRPWFLLNAGLPADAEPALQQAAAGLSLFDEELVLHSSAGAAALSATGPDRAAGAANDTCLFIYTSGTTGFPKGVMHSQRNLTLAGEGFVARLHVQPDERLLAVLPLFHINALLYSLCGALAAGATYVLAPRFSASTFWPLVVQSGATLVNTIAAITTILLKRPASEFIPGHSLRKLYGAPLTAEMIDGFRERFGVPHLIEGYGMSEIPGAINSPFSGLQKVGAMGLPSRHPDPAIHLADLRVVDDQGCDVADGETGELLCRTPMVMQGYYRDPQQTAASFQGEWFITGDLVRRDSDGYFWFVSRKKDIIRKRGENISGSELDRVISEHPGILEAAAVAVPSELGEDDILVAVVCRPGVNLGAEDVADWARARLAAIKVPRYVLFCDELPHTPTHRVAKFKLKADPTLQARAIDLGR
jgi:crotonobetaine/carnitine-CoA ligase